MKKIKGLICKECKRTYPISPKYVCEYCFGPLEVVYDYEIVKKTFTKQSIEKREPTMWRYLELLPIESQPIVGKNTGFTPLYHAKNLGEYLGVKKLYIKDDSVNHPTLSFKDRVVSVALTKAREFGFDTVACASTGNLANAVASHAANGKFKAYIFVPADLEMGKIIGTLIYDAVVIAVEGSYDQVNRLCTEIANKYNWAFVNINIRPFYSEGSKTYGFEIAEQLNWVLPDNVIVPVAGGSLITKIYKAFKELEILGFVDNVKTKMFAAQAEGCAPVVNAIKENSPIIKPVKPNTLAKSIAIGNPADGYYAVETVINSKGYGESVSDEEMIEGIKILASTEGIFTETAGGVTVAVAKKLIENGIIKKDETTVISITGQGLKTQEVVLNKISKPIKIKSDIKEFEKII